MIMSNDDGREIDKKNIAADLTSKTSRPDTTRKQ